MVLCIIFIEMKKIYMKSNILILNVNKSFEKRKEGDLKIRNVDFVFLFCYEEVV